MENEEIYITFYGVFDANSALSASRAIHATYTGTIKSCEIAFEIRSDKQQRITTKQFIS